MDEQEVCRDFKNGICNRKACHFFHPTDDQPDGNAVCNDFQNRGCERGASCRFLHITKDEEGVYKQTGQLHGGRLSNADKTVARRSQECVFYGLGKCKKGNECPFLHPAGVKQPVARMPPSHLNGGGDQSAISGPPQKPKYLSQSYSLYESKYAATRDYGFSYGKNAHQDVGALHTRNSELVSLREENTELTEKIKELKSTIRNLHSQNDELYELNMLYRDQTGLKSEAFPEQTQQ